MIRILRCLFGLLYYLGCCNDLNGERWINDYPFKINVSRRIAEDEVYGPY